ncbi:MAG: ABC transporter substrate-binding protein [Clostridiales bacterium]|nr:ABC transporter substrate-binding protein [Clostridiales bacterium]
MKRKLSALLTALLLLAVPLAACKKDGAKIRLCEVTHSIFYAPLYVAMTNGYFADEGLSVELSNGGGADAVMAAIASDSADIGLMGPEATIYCHVGGQRDYPVIFGQLTARDGSFLIGRTDEKATFAWSSLEGKKLIAGRKGGVPAMTLEYVLKNNGVSISAETFDTSVAFNLTAGTFEGDKSYDYCTLFEPVASEFEAAGKGYVIASVGEESGEVPYTAFSAKKKYIDADPARAEKFLRAVVRGYKYLRDNTPDIVAAALVPQFPDTPAASIAAAVTRYLEVGAWAATPVMGKTAFERLQDIMTAAGELTDRADYSLAVRNDIAEKVSAE